MRTLASTKKLACGLRGIELQADIGHVVRVVGLHFDTLAFRQPLLHGRGDEAEVRLARRERVLHRVIGRQDDVGVARRGDLAEMIVRVRLRLHPLGAQPARHTERAGADDVARRAEIARREVRRLGIDEAVLRHDTEGRDFGEETRGRQTEFEAHRVVVDAPARVSTTA